MPVSLWKTQADHRVPIQAYRITLKAVMQAYTLDPHHQIWTISENITIKTSSCAVFVQHIIANFGILDKMSHICSNVFFFFTFLC